VNIRDTGKRKCELSINIPIPAPKYPP
jgi:hypothetical protein